MKTVHQMSTESFDKFLLEMVQETREEDEQYRKKHPLLSKLVPKTAPAYQKYLIKNKHFYRMGFIDGMTCYQNIIKELEEKKE